MRVLFPSAEVAPFSKTGGLGDVAGALPQALAALGHEVLVVTPWYRTLAADPPPLWIGDVDAPFAGGFEAVGVGTLERDGVRYAFVGHDDFRRDTLYGYPDDVRRFARFVRAVPQVAERLGFLPDVVHLHDWHTAHLPMILANGWHLPSGFPGLPSVFTVHNVQHQGVWDLEETLWWLRVPGALRGSYLNHFGRANAMQAGVGFATRVTTVSPSYAEEIQRPEYGYGLDGTFRSLASKLVGILNGIDTAAWDPAHDPNLSAPFDADAVAGKAAAARALRARLDLADGFPILAVVSRFAEQKGIDLVLDATERLLAQGWSLCVLGTGDRALEAEARRQMAHHRGRVSGFVGYHEGLAHQVYAGADAIAIPSRFEPCGLSQMIAMRYGTIPIVRATGGLRDTVEHERTGFVFEHASTDGLAWAAGEAIRAYGTPAWAAMQRDGMRQDWSWQRSAKRYEALYASVLPSGS